MWTIFLLVLCCLPVQAEPESRHNGRAKREFLSRSKRRWVLSTIDLVEEDPGPYPKRISQLFNNKLSQDSKSHRYRITGMGVNFPPLGIFSIDQHNGTVFALKAVDREQKSCFHIRFDVFDDKDDVMDDDLSFDVEIKDLNDNAPIFKNLTKTVNVPENLPEGVMPAVFDVEDKDQPNSPNSTVVMRILGQEPKDPVIGLSQINNEKGELTFTGCFNYDKVKKYKVTLEARDKGKPPMSSTAVITLNILDSNTNPPVFKERTYSGSVMEATIKDDVLRVGVHDKDSPQTDGWRAVYTIISGNEMENYKIVTDPKTNEGVLGVIKGKDFEKTSKHVLKIGVRNKQALFVCGKTAPRDSARPFDDIVDVTVTVMDKNDAPVFDRKLVIFHQKEESDPGTVVLTPKVTDDENDPFSFVLLDDPAKWMTIDKKTGVVQTVVKMDRESHFVKGGIYDVLVGAVDEGKPPTTGTCTVRVMLMDINDNMPRLASNVVTLCGNKNNKVMVAGNDSDAHPYSGPFTFSLSEEDESLKELWEFNPSTGEEVGLISLKSLAYGSYSVPLEIQDQQGLSAKETLEVVVCDCQDKDSCRSRRTKKPKLGGAAIGLIFAALLLFLLMLLVVICSFGKKNFVPIGECEGSQTLIKYNQESGSAPVKGDAGLHMLPPSDSPFVDGVKLGSSQKTQSHTTTNFNVSAYNSHSMGRQVSRESSRSYRQYMNTGRSNGQQNSGWARTIDKSYSGWGASRSNSLQQGGTWRSQSMNSRNNQHISDYVDQRLYNVHGKLEQEASYKPCAYTYEGEGSKCQSLDELSLSHHGDDLSFLNDLGPKFKALGNITQQGIVEKKIKL